MLNRKLKCIEDFHMENGDLAYAKGQTYKIKDAWFEEYWAFTVESEISDDHLMEEDNDFYKFFELVEE